ASDLTTLGADVLPSTAKLVKSEDEYSLTSFFTLTRLHARYSKEALSDDLVFKTATPIEGGREGIGSADKPENGTTTSTYNNFQGRYIIRHPWTGAITCKDPRRGIWGGPPTGVAGSTTPQSALGLAFVPRGTITLESYLKQDLPSLDLKAAKTK